MRKINAEEYRELAAAFRYGNREYALRRAAVAIESAIRWLHRAGDRQRDAMQAGWSSRGMRQSATLQVNKAARHLGSLIELRARYVQELP